MCDISIAKVYVYMGQAIIFAILGKRGRFEGLCSLVSCYDSKWVRDALEKNVVECGFDGMGLH